MCKYCDAGAMLRSIGVELPGGQIITTFLIGCAVALVMWLFVQIFRPSKD